MCQEDRVAAHQHQDRRSSLDREDPEPPAIKEEEEEREPWCHQHGEKLTVKRESSSFTAAPVREEDDQSGDKVLDSDPDQRDEKPEMDTPGESSVSPEPDWDQQLLSNSPHVAGSDEQNDTQEDSGSTTDEGAEQSVKPSKRRRHRGNAKKPAEAAVDWDADTVTTAPTADTGEKQVKAKSDLTGDSRIQTRDDQPAPTTTCGKGWRGSCLHGTFSYKSHKHIKNYTGEKPHVCKTCGKAFKHSSTLTVHTRSHTGEKPYICKMCRKSFSSNDSLTKHMRVHTGEKPYMCKTCGNVFSHKSALTRHTRVHTGEKPFSCTTCGKSFSQTSALNKHTRVHTGEKPYLCKTCGKAFKQSSALIVHMRTHTGEKPFICKICGRTFKHSYTLTVHTKRHTGEKP